MIALFTPTGDKGKIERAHRYTNIDEFTKLEIPVNQRPGAAALFAIPLTSRLHCNCILSLHD